MKIYALIVAVVFLLPLFVLSYVTLVMGSTFTQEQWSMAFSLMFAGVFLEVPFLVWCMDQSYKRGE